jgi:lysozyme
MKTSNKGVELIKRFEGLRLKAYRDAGGIWTIGYGHTDGVNSDDVVTESEAENLLTADLETAESEINRLNLRLNQNQFDALVSFVFNVGAGNFRGSTLLKKVRANPNDASIRGEFAKWNKARIDGVLIPLPGLTKRRIAEANLYFTE